MARSKEPRMGGEAVVTSKGACSSSVFCPYHRMNKPTRCPRLNGALCSRGHGAAGSVRVIQASVPCLPWHIHKTLLCLQRVESSLQGGQMTEAVKSAKSHVHNVFFASSELRAACREDRRQKDLELNHHMCLAFAGNLSFLSIITLVPEAAGLAGLLCHHVEA